MDGASPVPFVCTVVWTHHGVLSLFGPGIIKRKTLPRAAYAQVAMIGVVLGMTARPGLDLNPQPMVGEVYPP